MLRPLGDARQLSLMFRSNNEEAECVLVDWVNPETKLGRLCKTDSQNRVISLMYARDIPQSFRDYAIVHPAIGISVKRAQGEGRPSVPPNILKLKQLWLASSDGATMDPCAVCKQADAADDSVRLCMLCLLPFHAQCSDGAAEILNSRIARMVCPLKEMVPRDWDLRNLCSMCSVWVCGEAIISCCRVDVTVSCDFSDVTVSCIRGDRGNG